MSEDTPNTLPSDSEPPFSNALPLNEMTGGDDMDTSLLRNHAREAQEYLLSFDWCVSIVDCYFGDGIGGVVAVFLFRIVPAGTQVDEWLWVVVGDLPPAYFVVEDIKSPREALDAYIWHRSRWVESVLCGRVPPENVMPVTVGQTREMAEALSRRLKFLSEKVLPQFRR